MRGGHFKRVAVCARGDRYVNEADELQLFAILRRPNLRRLAEEHKIYLMLLLWNVGDSGKKSDKEQK